MLLVTGGAGFIGSNFVLSTLAAGEPVVNVDKLTYAGSLANLEAVRADARHSFLQADIADRERMREALAAHRPRAIVHFAAETHVDRSIAGPAPFVQTNVLGTWALLEEALAYWKALRPADKEAFRFLHVSTDEVFGSLGADEPPFTEDRPYAPSSPYAASKAASDHMARAYARTYGLPVLIVNASNNYGPRQFPEKLIPLVIGRALAGKEIPVYGDGENVRDWLHVDDHCEALRLVLAHGKPGESYNIGGGAERSNNQVVRAMCAALDELQPSQAPHARLIRYVADRPGHDRRYANDTTKLRRLGWRPRASFESALAATVRWYVEHP